jgi:hypothetical protein
MSFPTWQEALAAEIKEEHLLDSELAEISRRATAALDSCSNCRRLRLEVARLRVAALEASLATRLLERDELADLDARTSLEG